MKRFFELCDGYLVDADEITYISKLGDKESAVHLKSGCNLYVNENYKSLARKISGGNEEVQ